MLNDLKNKFFAATSDTVEGFRTSKAVKIFTLTFAANAAADAMILPEGDLRNVVLGVNALGFALTAFGAHQHASTNKTLNNEIGRALE